MIAGNISACTLRNLRYCDMDLSPQPRMAGWALDDEKSSSSDKVLGMPTKNAFFNFLQLPTEIRLKIYEALFACNVDERPARPEIPTDTNSDTVRSRVVTPTGFDLTMVNKQIHNESLPVLYNSHLFRLSSWTWNEPFDGRRRLSYEEAAEQLLTQLLRPSAPSSLALMTQIHLFLGSGWSIFSLSEKKGPILLQICINCTNLEFFCLQMNFIPQQWASSEPELQALKRPEDDALTSLCDLASRVRYFEIHETSYHRRDDGQYEGLCKHLVPDQTWVRTKEDSEVRWKSNLAGKVRSLVFHVLQ